jgi:hypothetical protein
VICGGNRPQTPAVVAHGQGRHDIAQSTNGWSIAYLRNSRLSKSAERVATLPSLAAPR